MKCSFSLTIFIVLFFFSCNNSDNKDTKDQTPATLNEGSHCYAYINNKDSILLHVDIKDNLVTGELSYDFYEKDKNTGTIQGEMKGDTLLADYSFVSEGVSSVREVVFLKKEHTFLEGHGDAEQVDNKLIFTNRSTLHFSTVLKETGCEK
ncbi:MAG: hypothetical protein QM802_08325 [Agriterribacter sp.]